MNKGMNEFRIKQHVSLDRCKILLFDGDAEYADFSIIDAS